jgi:hypothetical protein
MAKRIQLRQSVASDPDDIVPLFGTPPVLSTEDPKTYLALLRKVTEVIKPKTILEQMWVIDVVYHSWHIARLRRFKVLLIEEERSSLADEAMRLPFGSAIEARRKSCPAERSTRIEAWQLHSKIPFTSMKRSTDCLNQPSVGATQSCAKSTNIGTA